MNRRIRAIYYGFLTNSLMVNTDFVSCYYDGYQVIFRNRRIWDGVDYQQQISARLIWA
jgi:hypothetical protein